MSRVAINLCDLDLLNGKHTDEFTMAGLLLRDFCTDKSLTSPPIGDRWDEVGIILDGPASKDEARVNALVELLQLSLGPRKINRRVRCYREGTKGGWSQIMPGKTNRELMRDLKEQDDDENL